MKNSNLIQYSRETNNRSNCIFLITDNFPITYNTYVFIYLSHHDSCVEVELCYVIEHISKGYLMY